MVGHRAMSSKSATKGGRLTSCVGSNGFKPEDQVRNEDAQRKALELLERDDLRGAITSWFELPSTDSYAYHAFGTTHLAEVQHVIGLGAKNGLHDWYRDSDGNPLPPPPLPDIEAYIAIFSAQTSTASSLKSLLSNAKKASLRASVARHLTAKRFIHPSLAAKLAIPKCKSPPANPYLDFWAWSSRNLQWAGPCPETERGQQSHHVLPILMHHFGCACPSYESLEILRIFAAGRAIADIGSGNGYWAFSLRQHGLAVHAVDSMQSEWRVSWLPASGPNSTAISDGVTWLSRKENSGGKDMVLLLVYPVVGGGISGGTEGAFTRGLMDAYQGDTVAVVGTQNHNGYTGFKDMTMDEYVTKEQPEWTKVVQIPLPSFAGKDEALFIFQRGGMAPKADGRGDT